MKKKDDLKMLDFGRSLLDHLSERSFICSSFVEKFKIKLEGG